MEREFRQSSFFGGPEDNRHRGPNLGIVALVYTALALASFVVAVVVTRGAFPAPIGVDYLPRFYFAGYLPAVGISAFLQFAAAIPLGIFAATAASRMRFFGLDVAGVFIAFFGGAGAALFTALSGLMRWTLSERAVSTLPYVPLAIRMMSFAIGAIGFAVLFGLLVAGISITAWFTGLLPRWLAVFGMVVFALAEITSLALLLNPLTILAPIVELLGFVWMIAAGFLLPRVRRQAGQTRFAQAA